MFFIPSAITQAFIFSVTIFEFPDASRYYTGFLEQQFELDRWILIPSLFLVEFMIFLHMWGGMLFYLFSVVLYLFYVLYWTNEMR